MSHVLICREAIEDSVLGNLALARSFIRKGLPTCLIFTGEALHALDTGTFQWSRNFQTREAQAKVIAASERVSLPLAHQALDHRWSDIRALLASFHGEPNLRLLACPIWAGLLDLESIPEFLESIDEGSLIDLLKSAESIIGGY